MARLRALVLDNLSIHLPPATALVPGASAPAPPVVSAPAALASAAPAAAAAHTFSVDPSVQATSGTNGVVGVSRAAQIVPTAEEGGAPPPPAPAAPAPGGDTSSSSSDVSSSDVSSSELSSSSDVSDSSSSDDGGETLAVRAAAGGAGPSKRPRPRPDASSDDSSDDSSSDDGPLAARQAKIMREADADRERRRAEKAAKERKPAVSRDRKKADTSPKKRAPKPAADAERKWTVLHHNGVLFPPPYVAHGVKMLYDGAPVDLTPAQEEVATMYAGMHGSDYLTKAKFNENFFEDWGKLLGPGHVIRDLDKCDFSPIVAHLAREKAKRDAMTREEKAALKDERLRQEEPFTWATVDGRREKIGNFRVEPPGLFRGRGEHPLMGKLKTRVMPEQVTLNLSECAKVPDCPVEGHKWKEVVTKPTSTWLAYWIDPITEGTSRANYKYVFLSAESAWKGKSDLDKYEKARRLKGCIDRIRKSYRAGWLKSDTKGPQENRQMQQISVAMYLIDYLALRAGHEKGEDEADTVGCCTLKCENVEPEGNNILRFDFIGKDSMKYEDSKEVDPAVYKLMSSWKLMDIKGNSKSPSEQLFDAFDANDLNKALKNYMDGLSAKVFRTLNASVTLEQKLCEADAEASKAHGAKLGADTPWVDDAMSETPQQQQMRHTKQKAAYDLANKVVAILCNHQRSVPKTHGANMEKASVKLNAIKDELKLLERDLTLVKSGKALPDGRKGTEEQLRGRIASKRAQVERGERQLESREELSTVALGTSKINYMDPRITIAWCKRNDVPLEKVFNKSLISKFHWCADVEPDFSF